MTLESIQPQASPCRRGHLNVRFTSKRLPMLRMCGAISLLPHMPSRRGAELSTGTTLSFTFYTFREGGNLALIRFGSGSERKSTCDPHLSLPRTTSLRFKDVFARGSSAAILSGILKLIIVVQYALF